MGKPAAERFLSYVAKANSGCWEWTGYRLPRGYGLFSMNGSHVLAHRAAYELFKGEIDDGMLVMHSCDNPSCVNPDHLTSGSQKDNMADAARKGRTAQKQRHGRCKLTASQVEAIRAAEGSQYEIARRFSISQTHVWQLKHRARWS